MTKISWSRFFLLWLAGIDLRITMLAVPPLLPFIHHDLKLDETGVAVLLGLPLLLFAAAATIGSMLISRFDARRALIFGLFVVGASSAMRGVGPSLTILFAMTFAMGASIAIVQPALPAMVYHWAPAHVGLATAVYSNGFLAGEVVAAGFTTKVVPLLGGWPLALGVWGILPVVTAALLWTTTAPLPKSASAEQRRWWPDFGHARTWRLGLAQSGGAIIFFGCNAFFPDYLHAIGASRLIAPSLVWLNAGQLPASILIALWPSWFVGRIRPIQVSGLLAAAGLAVFFVPHEWARLSGAGILGFAAAFAFILNLALPAVLAEHSEDVHRISAGMFTIGYGMGFLLPLLGGTVWDRTGIAAASLAPAAIGALLLVIAPRGIEERSLSLIVRIATDAAAASTSPSSREL
ncbi:MAG TPA: MFS transporter [Candidatus Binataceae bacterium]|nr:MFS transporter [Candidatus Binataceae bacterium]